jgi:hypothetical protein
MFMERIALMHYNTCVRPEPTQPNFNGTEEVSI